MNRNKKIDEALESVLLAGGLSFKYIPNEEALNAMREAMLSPTKESLEKEQALYKYMKHIISSQGSSLIDSVEYEGILSNDDIKLLRKIESEIYQQN